MEDVLYIVDEINRLNVRSLDLSYVGNRQFFEEYDLVHNSIDLFVKCRDNELDEELDEELEKLDFDEMVWLADALEKRYRREEYRRRTGIELPEDYEWEEY